MSAEIGCFPGAHELEDELVSVPLPVDMIAALRVVVFQRQSLGDADASIAQLVQQAVADWVARELDEPTDLAIGT